MKKKLILSNSLVVTFILLRMTFFSCYCAWNINKTNQENSRRTELAIIGNIYDNQLISHTEDNSQKTVIELVCGSHKDLRITFLALDGKVLRDSGKTNVSENHLDRPEIKNPGSFAYRYSKTLDEKRMYLADFHGNIYIRLAKPLGFVYSAVQSVIILSSSLRTLEILLVIFVNVWLVNRKLRPLQTQLNRLATLGGSKENKLNSLDIELISTQIDSAEHVIKDKIRSLREEEEKLSYIINTRNHGLIVLDQNLNVLLINSKAKEIFDIGDSKVLSFFDITINPDLIELTKKATANGSALLELKLNNRFYSITADSMEAKWAESQGKKALAISLFDRTNEKTLADTKRDFFANASHELKTPLTTILGFSEMIKNGFLTEKSEIDSALSRIIFEGKRRNAIIMQRLDLSRLETESPEKETSVLSVKNEIQSVCTPFNEQRQHHGISAHYETQDDFDICMREEDFQEMLKNLMENAIRYNKENGEIFLITDSKTRTLIVKDTGIGIAEEHLTRIFERFYRVDKAHSRKLGGTGLGLSIVKHICINNKIQLSVQSKVNVGTSFILQFPEISKENQPS